MSNNQLQQNFMPMAVVGMACNLPGATNLDEYWSLLYEGRSGIIPFPNDRLDASTYYTEMRGQFGKTYCKVAGIVDHKISENNSEIITEELRNSFDPSHITLLDVVLSAIRDAGWKQNSLAGSRTGIYIGNSDSSEVPSKMTFHSHRKQLSGLLNHLSSDLFPDEKMRLKMISHIEKEIEKEYPSYLESSLVEYASNASASLVAQVLKSSGPCIALDAACASSSVAILSAQHALKSNQVDTAIVGAASYRTWCELVMLSQIQSLGTKQSSPFDSSADGFIGADGYAAVILKSLDKAIEDGDQIHGVIQSLGFSSDGRGKSFWAPRTEGQSLAIKRAYENGIDPSRLQYIETHATSTQLGDATEIQSLMNSLGEKVNQKIPVASVKANIGHSLETAGLASLIKVLLGMKNGIIPPAINISSSNKDIDWNSVPFFPVLKATEWPELSDGHPRRAGINAFGIGGLNSHLVVDQFNNKLKSESIAVSKKITTEENQKYSGKIAVIGMGCLLPGALTVQDFWNQMMNGQTGIYEISEEKNIHEIKNSNGKSFGPKYFEGTLNGWEFDWRKHKIPPKQLANANPVQFMVLDAAVQAVEDSGYDKKEFDRTRVGTIVGSIFSSNFASDTFLSVRLPDICKMITAAVEADKISAEQLEKICSEYGKALLKQIRASQDESASFNSSTIASRITKVFDLMGGAFAVDAGNASSIAALNTAMGLLNNHVNDMVICAAGHQKNDQIAYEQYIKNGTLSHGIIKSPFDSDFDGIVPGEGAAVVVLKRLEDAERDGDQIYGVLNQISAVTNVEDSNEAFTSSIQELNSESRIGSLISLDLNGSASHMKKCLIDVSTTSEKFSNTKIHASNLVSQFGDLGGVAGMASLIKNMKSIQTGSIPGNQGLINIASELSGNYEKDQFEKISLEETEKENLQALIVSENNNGFQNDGGNVWSVLVSSKTFSKDKLSENQKNKKPEKDEVGRILIQLAVEQSGFPAEIVNLDSRFDYDFHWEPDYISEYFHRLKTVFNFEDDVLKVTDLLQMKCLNEVLEKLADNVTVTISNGFEVSNCNQPIQYRLRAVESPLNENIQNESTANRIVVVLGDGFISDALSCLENIRYYHISSSQNSSLILNELMNVMEGNQLTDLIITTEFDTVTTLSYDELLNVVQEWKKLICSKNSNGKITVSLVTKMGGEFGVQSRAIQSQTISDWTELILLMNQDQIEFKLIDFSPRDPEKLISKLLTTEFASSNSEFYAGYIRGKRHVLRAIPQSVESINNHQSSMDQKSMIQNGFHPEMFPDASRMTLHETLFSRLKESSLIQDASVTDLGSIVCHTEYSPMNEPFLDGHRVEGVPLLPAVIAIETMSESAILATGAECVTTVRNLKLVNGFRMPLDQIYFAKVDTSVENQTVACELKGDFYNKNGQFIEPHRLYQTAMIDVSNQPLNIESSALKIPSHGEWIDIRYASHWARLEEGNTGTVFYGPELQTLKQIQYTENGIWGKFIAPSKVALGGQRSRGAHWQFPSALFDGLMFSADLYAKEKLNSPMQLPSEIEQIQFSTLPDEGELITGWAEYIGDDKRKLFFNLTLFKEDGTVILQCKNCTLVKLI